MKNLDEKILPQDDAPEQDFENRVLLVEGSKDAIIREEEDVKISTEEINETLFVEEADSDFAPEEIVLDDKEDAVANEGKSKKKDKKKKSKKDKKKKAKNKKNKKKRDKKKKNDKKAKKDKKKKKKAKKSKK
ncbi:MAG: hypothetical protein UDB11_10325 [Peptococcaceae bacterium]|nr:hypothetical protein [Peptococcaceae bacterium]